MLREWLIRLWGTVRPARRDADLEDELRAHLELAAEDERRRAGPGDDAWRAAVIKCGPVAQTMEALREQRGLPWLDGVRRDLGYAWRGMRRNPGFTLVTTTTLGAGLGLCLTVVTVVNGYVLRALPYPTADRLHSVVLGAAGQEIPRGLADLDWTAVDSLVDHRIAWDLDMFYLLGGAYPEAARGAWVTPGFVRALGVRAERGRVLEAGDFTPAGPTAVMISQRLWVSRFAGDPDIVGRELKAYVSDRPDEPETLIVVGILPADFWHVNAYTDVLGPLRAPTYPYLVTLREGIDRRSAGERVTALIRASVPALAEDWRATLVPLQARYSAEMRPLLASVAVSAGLVLLIACANIAVLLLVRSAKRRHEVAIRLALGASRAGLARLLGFEAALLGGIATALGLGASALLTRALAPLIEQHLGRRLPGGDAALAQDGTVLLAALTGGAFVALVLTLAPLATLWSTPVGPALKSGGRGTTEGRMARRLRSALVAGEVAAALALLVASVLMIRSAVQMLQVHPGFRAAGLLTTSVGLRPRTYPDAVSRAAFFNRLLHRLDERPDGGRSALGDAWPLQSAHPTRVESVGVDAAATEAAVVRVTAGYFATLGIGFHDGGTFAAEDRVGGEPVVVVSRSLARRFWPGRRAVGQQLRIPDAGADDMMGAAGAPTYTPHRVVGVVADVTQVGYDDGRVRADTNQLDAYAPLLQTPGRFAFLYTPHASNAPDTLRSIVAALDPEAATAPPTRLAAALDEARRGPRQLAWVLSSFAVFAGLLALLGVYSVIAYGVRQRQREIGVRLVVGADARTITRLFVREGHPLVLGGVLLGLLAAALLGRILESQLFGVEPVEPVVLAATAAAFATCGWLALWWPARRAARVDPAQVLKVE